MPVFSSLTTSKRKTKNRQKWLYGYSTSDNAMQYLNGNGALMDAETIDDVVRAGIDFAEADGDNMDAESAVPTYISNPLIASLSMNGSMGNMLSFSFSYLIHILDGFDTGLEDRIIFADSADTPINYGTTRYYCQGENEPIEFSWNVSTSVVNSGCIETDSGTGDKTGKVKVSSFNASFTQKFEVDSAATNGGWPEGDNTYTNDTGGTETVDYCTKSLFLPYGTGSGTGGNDSKALLALWDFDVSEKGTEYDSDNYDGILFITAECSGIPEIPTDWKNFDVYEGV